MTNNATCMASQSFTQCRTNMDRDNMLSQVLISLTVYVIPIYYFMFQDDYLHVV